MDNYEFSQFLSRIKENNYGSGVHVGRIVWQLIKEDKISYRQMQILQNHVTF